MAALAERLEELPQNVLQRSQFPLGVFRGLRFGLVLHPQHRPEVYLEGRAFHQDTLTREHQGPRALLNALERLVSGFGIQCGRMEQDLAIAEAQLRDFQGRLGTPFLHDSYFSQLTGLRDLLRAGLSGVPAEPGKETTPGVPELAERIQTLRSAHIIEAAPSRVDRRSLVAEEPVTTRILRRAEALPVAGPDPMSPVGRIEQPREQTFSARSPD